MTPSPLSQNELLQKYVNAVMAAPRSLGLTATRDPVEFWERHVLDALKLISLLPKAEHDKPFRVMDVGSGNGVPGIPIGIAVPNWQVNLLDSDNKKCGFLDMFCKSLSLNNIHVIAQRSEVAAHRPELREQFDLVFARALGKLPVALELTLPFLKRNGTLIIPHGQSYKSELPLINNALKELGAAFKEAVSYPLNPEITFTALFFLKIAETPERYPRNIGVPRKRPL